MRWCPVPVARAPPVRLFPRNPVGGVGLRPVPDLAPGPSGRTRVNRRPLWGWFLRHSRRNHPQRPGPQSRSATNAAKAHPRGAKTGAFGHVRWARAMRPSKNPPELPLDLSSRFEHTPSVDSFRWRSQPDSAHRRCPSVHGATQTCERLSPWDLAAATVRSLLWHIHATLMPWHDHE